MVWKKKLRSPQYTFNSEKVFLVATQPSKSIYSYLQTTKLGLTQGEVQERQSIYGRNEVVHEQKKNPFILFIKTFINPFIGVLTGLAIISLFLDVLMADPGEQEWTGVIIISSMVLFSAILRFWQEWRASEATDSLMKMVKNVRESMKKRSRLRNSSRGISCIWQLGTWFPLIFGSSIRKTCLSARLH